MDRTNPLIARNAQTRSKRAASAIAHPRKSKSPVAAQPKHITPSQLIAMPKARREKIMQQQFDEGAELYARDPGLIMDGSEDFVKYKFIGSGKAIRFNHDDWQLS